MDQAGIQRIRYLLKKYQYVLLILLLGIILMLIPTAESQHHTEISSNQEATADKAEPLQERLSRLLSLVEGAGKVSILLTEAVGEQTRYQTDSSSETRTDTVIVTDSGRNQTGLIQRIDPPRYLGAVVLCQGAERPSVRLAITEAVANATGLSFDKITVLKMK